MTRERARRAQYATADGWYAPTGQTGECMRVLTAAGGQWMAGEALSSAVFKGASAALGRALKNAVARGLVESRRTGNSWEWRRLWPVADTVADKMPQAAASFAGPVPRCSSEAEYKEWRVFALQARPAADLGFCEDCTPEYQTEMKLQEKCENPHVVFIGCVAGFRRVG